MTSHSNLVRTLSLALTFALAACSSSPDAKNNASGDLIKERPQVSSSASADVAPFITAGNQAFASSKWEDAAESWGNAAAKQPTWDMHMNKAIALSFKPDFEGSILEMDRCMNAGGDSEWVAWFNLGNIYTNRGLYEEAITAYRAGLSLHDRPHVDSLLNISAGYMFLAKHDEARATATYVTQLSPDDPRGHHNLALVFQLEERYDLAIDGYERVHEIDPNFAQSYFNKGVVFGRYLDKPNEAIRSLNRYLELEPNGPYARRAKERIRTYGGQ